MPESRTNGSSEIGWFMQMKGASIGEPSQIVRLLTGGVLGCGGWVLRRGATDTGAIKILFEFERAACVEIYSLLVAAGIELNYNGHRRFTELCQCTRSHLRECEADVASVELEIQTFAQNGPEEISAKRCG